MRPSSSFTALSLSAFALVVGCGGGDATNSTGVGGAGGAGATAGRGASVGATSSGGGAGGATSSSGSNATNSASSSAGTGAGGNVVSVVGISTQPDTSSEAENGIALGTNGIVSTAWITTPTGNFDIRYAFSTDDGANWGPPAIASGDPTLTYDDPSMATAPDGTIWLAFEGYDATRNYIFAAKADPGTTTFGPQIEVNDPAASATPWDKPWVTVTASGTVIVTFADVDGHLYASRSTDGGQSWNVSTIVSDASYRDLAYPCPAQGGGRVWVVYYNDAIPAIAMKYSDDEGATWLPNQEIIVNAPTETDLTFDDPTCVGVGNELWVAYDRTTQINVNTSNTEQMSYAIRVAHSGDGGLTFDSRVDAHDAAVGPFYMLPTIVREPGGAIDIAYYAGTKKKDPLGSLRAARSTDGGKTFGPSVALAAPIVFSQSRIDALWLGDYFGLATAGGRLYASYANNISGAAHIDFTSAPVP